MKFNKSKLPSRHVSVGVKSAPHRSMYYAMGLKSTDIALADTMFLDVTGRTAKRLLEMAGESDEFQLPITQEELAGMSGASRERVNKSISSFIKFSVMSQSWATYVSQFVNQSIK